MTIAKFLEDLESRMMRMTATSAMRECYRLGSRAVCGAGYVAVSGCAKVRGAACIGAAPSADMRHTEGEDHARGVHA